MNRYLVIATAGSHVDGRLSVNERGVRDLIDWLADQVRPRLHRPIQRKRRTRLDRRASLLGDEGVEGPEGTAAAREVDRSPTGSGTAGRAALLFAQGRLEEGETFVNESIIGTLMGARVLRRTRVGEFDAVVPEISGTAHVCGQASWTLDRHDPLRYGFLVR